MTSPFDRPPISKGYPLDAEERRAVQANPVREDGRVRTVVGCGVALLILLGVAVVAGLFVLVMLEPLPL